MSEQAQQTQQTQQMIDYIKSDVIRRADIQIDENTPLVSSGLIDSLALVDILMKLEDVTRCDACLVRATSSSSHGSSSTALTGPPKP